MEHRPLDADAHLTSHHTVPRGAVWRRRLAWGCRVASQWVRRQLGLPVVIDTADRRVLEGAILPHYANRPDVRRVLFVGTRWYTQAYEARFAHAFYATLDIDPQAARYGSHQHHVTASASEADRHFEPGSFDLVVFNGVFGWGLNARDDVEAAVHAFARLLRPGGELVVGWNDVPRYRPFPFSEVLALQALQPLQFAPLRTQALQLETDNRHRFEFFRKPG